MIFGVGAQSKKRVLKKIAVPSCNFPRRSAKEINEIANQARIERRMRRSSKNQKARPKKIEKKKLKC